MKLTVFALIVALVFFASYVHAGDDAPQPTPAPKCRLVRKGKKVFKKCLQANGTRTIRICRRRGRDAAGRVVVCCKKGVDRIIKKKKGKKPKKPKKRTKKNKKGKKKGKGKLRCKKVHVCKKASVKCLKKNKGVCVKRKLRCIKPSVQRKCWIKVRKTKCKFVGPKKCPPGFVLKFTKKGKKIIRSCVKASPKPKPEIQCWSTGDPHFTALSKKRYDYYRAGDYLLAKTADGLFEAHVRHYHMKQWGTNAINKAVAAKINGRDVVAFHGKGRRFTFNGKAIQVNAGQTINFPNGGSLRLININHFEIYAVNGVRLVGHFAQVNAHNFYMNLYVFVPASLRDGTTGLCANVPQYIKVGGLFSKHYEPRFLEIPLPKVSKKVIKKAVKFCKNGGLKGRLFKNCVFDFKVAGRKFAKAETTIKKDIKQVVNERHVVRKIKVTKIKFVKRNRDTGAATLEADSLNRSPAKQICDRILAEATAWCRLVGNTAATCPKDRVASLKTQYAEAQRTCLANSKAPQCTILKNSKLQFISICEAKKFL